MLKILYSLINQYGVDFGTGYALEFTGETIKVCLWKHV